MARGNGNIPQGARMRPHPDAHRALQNRAMMRPGTPPQAAARAEICGGGLDTTSCDAAAKRRHEAIMMTACGGARPPPPEVTSAFGGGSGQFECCGGLGRVDGRGLRCSISQPATGACSRASGHPQMPLLASDVTDCSPPVH
jgi:hypothetical protein